MKRVILPAPPSEDQSHDDKSQLPASEPATSREKLRPRQSQGPPPEVMDILIPSLKVGAVAGACGLFTGAAAGIIRSAPTVFFSVISGGQCFVLGSSYYATRLSVLQYFSRTRKPTSGDKVKASTVAGGVAGTLGGLLRGPRNVLPGALVFSLLGAGGQGIVNWRTARAANAPPSSGGGFWSRFSRVTRLSDQDYEKMLEEKLLRVEADLAIVDERIKELRDSETSARDASTPPQVDGSKS